jgi:hypothetical protein
VSARRADDPVTERNSCLPCCYGVHAACRHRPNGPRFSSPGSEAGKPCACETSGHTLGGGFCDGRSSDSWSSYRCGRPVKSELVVRSGDGWSFVSRAASGEPDEATVQVCGIHRAAVERRRKNDARREAEWAAHRERWDEAERASRSAIEWAARLRSEFGVDATAEDEVVAVNAERLYGQIVEAMEILLDVVGPDHPFRPDRLEES